MSKDSEILWRIFEKLVEKTFSQKVNWTPERGGKLGAQLGEFYVELEPELLSVFDSQSNLLGTVTNGDSGSPLDELRDAVGSLYTEAKRQALRIPDKLKKLDGTLDNLD